MEEDIKILEELATWDNIKLEKGDVAIENILNRLEQDERVIEEMAKQLEKDAKWYLSDFDDMAVEDIINHFRKKCE